MDGNNQNKWWLYLVIVVILFLLGFFVCKYIEIKKDLRETQKIFDTQIELLENQKDSLQAIINQSQERIDSLQCSISEIERRIAKSKKRIYEKVDSIVKLPVDSAIVFFTNQISSEMDKGN